MRSGFLPPALGGFISKNCLEETFAVSPALLQGVSLWGKPLHWLCFRCCFFTNSNGEELKVKTPCPCVWAGGEEFTATGTWHRWATRVLPHCSVAPWLYRWTEFSVNICQLVPACEMVCVPLTYASCAFAVAVH